MGQVEEGREVHGSAENRALNTDEIRRLYHPDRFAAWGGERIRLLDTVKSLCDALDVERAEVDLLRDVLVFADGFVVTKTMDDPFPMVLADLYNTTCPAAQAIQRAGCHSRGKFRRALDSDGSADATNTHNDTQNPG